ncbi:hypothetical protein [Candidatus Neptunochlamydia vexilliferae]|uniref:Transposase n=1 Tax=Candidatus Neptunichlamydia vexilliferae TaxID=1651774 RepID=A0ABS0AZK0_9BACT|nr:hypothetical protein [Candidatus Neptunochlamydia vexilliferae]MBF5059551.1 hypothetical protein [Candidatus Neptunochlamydia vexilliferae]
MKALSENTDQNSRKKCKKVYRSQSTVSRKVVAFEEFMNLEHHKNSERCVAKLLEVPNSTMRSWRKKESDNEELSAFFETPVGAIFLEKNVLAVMKISKCGPSGIRGVEDYLQCLEKSVCKGERGPKILWQYFFTPSCKGSKELFLPSS